MSNSKIEWTEQTWNPITGCTKVSAGCKNCYAEVIAKRFWKDRNFTDIQLHEDRLKQPLHWKRPRMVFVNSMSDLFHEKVDYKNIAKIFEMMRLTPKHTYQILTKRPENALRFFKWWFVFDETSQVTDNIWLGISVENQQMADERLAPFSQFPSKIKFVSYEPALSEVNWSRYEFIDWIIAGGESGAMKRPNDIDWFRKTRDWAKENNIAFFMKQIDKVQEIPEDLMIREYPLQNSL